MINMKNREIENKITEILYKNSSDDSSYLRIKFENINNVIKLLVDISDQQAKALTDEIEEFRNLYNASLEMLSKCNDKVEELKKELKMKTDYYEDKLEHQYIAISEHYKENQQLQSRISELEKGNEWISIEDKLPNHREQVLGFPKQYPFGLIRECSYEEYTGQDLEWFKEAFSHWMPLPNNPKTN